MDPLIRIILWLLAIPLAVVLWLVWTYMMVGLYSLVTSFPTRSNKRSEDYYEKHHIPRDDRTWSSYDDYLDSDTWKFKRKDVLSRASYECEVDDCGSKAVEVHHKKYPKVWGHETLDDLIAVCKSCHDDLHPDKPDRNRSDMTVEEAKEKLKDLGVDID